MGVSKNRGTPKWMVKIIENPTKMDDLRVPLFLETSTFWKPPIQQEETCFFFQVRLFLIKWWGSSRWVFQDLRGSCEFPRNFEKHPMWNLLVNHHSNGISPFLIGNTSWKGPFSIAMLDYRSVHGKYAWILEKRKETCELAKKKVHCPSSLAIFWRHSYTLHI